MKLSADSTSPHNHPVVNFITDVCVDGVALKNIVELDTDTGVCLCITLPPTDDGTGHLKTHTVQGKVEIVWRATSPKSENGIIDPNKMFKFFKQDWEERERGRKARYMQGIPGYENVILHKGNTENDK